MESHNCSEHWPIVMEVGATALIDTTSVLFIFDALFTATICGPLYDVIASMILHAHFSLSTPT